MKRWFNWLSLKEAILLQFQSISNFLFYVPKISKGVTVLRFTPFSYCLIVNTTSIPYTCRSLIWNKNAYISYDISNAAVEMAQLICGGCRTLLMYTRNADTVRCSCCSTVNLVRPGNANSASSPLVYPYELSTFMHLTNSMLNCLNARFFHYIVGKCMCHSWNFRCGQFSSPD